MIARKLTAGELIHRFRRKRDWESQDEWNDDLKRIVDTVEAEAVAAERSRLVEVYRAEINKINDESRSRGMPSESQMSRIATIGWAIQQITEAP